MPEDYAMTFGLETELERYILSKAAPLVAAGGTSTLDLPLGDGPDHFHAQVGVRVGRGDAEVIQELGLRGLLFGAAWKVLDVLLESALGPKPGTSRWSILEKVQAARTGSVRFFPFNAQPDILSRVLLSYANTVEYRHSLVHRRATLRDNGELSGRDAVGRPLRSLSRVEQEAFCRMVQWVSGCVISGALPDRVLRRLGADLDALTEVTSCPPMGYVALHGPIPRVRIHVRSGQQLDMVYIKRRIRASWAEMTEVDLYVLVDDLDGLQFVCELEHAPDERFTLDAEAPPDWLQRI